ncbi:probable G-protein coupled receptor Mth-like 2 [Drosophila teissieri]|uniref:probable G-protein coupled receptor Mth-like 2 n=1 Tax=Drosophila teissieri TaxID=7243 RepID=UPI001CB9EFE2|nr:probable G-protein coupled receptor Mth-like 2 [Drosophila teissieri]XP_043646734.1 probable G-protein coupled receptor Mth-like 2 [Drosophila teissieri]
MLLLGSLITYLLLKLQSVNAEIADCNFFDTVDISEGQRLSNGSYLYENLLVPAHLMDVYEFKLLANGEKEQVPSHVRGCVCKLRTCVRFCCPHDHLMDNGGCVPNMTAEEQEVLDPILNVTLADGSVVQRHFKDDLIVQGDLPVPPCQMFALDNRHKLEEYTLFENGTFLRHLDHVYLDKREYCLQHLTFQDIDSYSIRIAAHNCVIEPKRMGQTVVMIISMICILLAMAVFLGVKKLRNLYGNCLVCYVACLFFGFLFLLLNLWQLSVNFCQTAGYLGYFFVMAAFFWLSVMSWHLWKFLTHITTGSDSAFLRYSCYAWGMALALTGVTFLADRVIGCDDWRPNMGNAGHCWISTYTWSAMLYFYGPMVIILLFNITMFILTAKHFIGTKLAVRKCSSQDGLKQDQINYLQLLSLFTLMGISWSIEIFTYLTQDDNLWVNVVGNYFNWSQGIIIFVLFILKPKTLRLLKEQIFPQKKGHPIQLTAPQQSVCSEYIPNQSRISMKL